MDRPSPDPDAFARLFAAKVPESVGEMRRLLDGMAGFVNAGLPAVGALHEGVPVADGVAADVIVPPGPGPHPVLVYLHGGGWVCGSARTHRKLAHRFAEAGHLVVNVDYRLAPEHPFPTPFEDCRAAVEFAVRKAPRFGGDPARLALAGDSAGANLAAAVAADLADSEPRPRALVLLYGVFDFPALASSPASFGPLAEGPMAEAGRRLVDLLVESYLGPEPPPSLLSDPRVSPLHAAHRLPPTHVVVGSADPLASQAESLARALAEAGVPHEHHVDPGMPHGYLQMEFLEGARPALERALAFLERHVGEEG